MGYCSIPLIDAFPIRARALPGYVFEFKFFFSCIFFFLNFFVIKTLDPDCIRIRIWIGIQPKMLDPDPYQMNTNPQPCGDICSSRCTIGVVDNGGKWEKSLISKILIILFGHLWVVDTFFLSSSNEGVSSLIFLPLVENLPPVSLIPVVHISPRISKNFEMTLMLRYFQGLGGR